MLRQSFYGLIPQAFAPHLKLMARLHDQYTREQFTIFKVQAPPNYSKFPE